LTLKGCEVAGCPSEATGTINACGTVYVCDNCRALIDDLATEYAAAMRRELAATLATTTR
jgi:hypothetical protein